ncbi:MAG: tetratricopeptide repeat protein [Helicobacteraceae bacterium]|nr:tetratricopeptide repeat protein [Helicobacteraceae bacterium]
MEYYTQAIELDPKDASAYKKRGSAYYELKNYDQAIKDYTKAIELNTKYHEAYNGRGNAYAELGISNHSAGGVYALNRAIDDYTQAIALYPNSSAYYHNRSTAYEAIREHGKARDDARRACALGDCGRLNIVYGEGSTPVRKIRRY